MADLSRPDGSASRLSGNDGRSEKSAEPPGGLGEAGTSAIVPAISNAIFAATGKRLRKMPVDASVLKQPA